MEDLTVMCYLYGLLAGVAVCLVMAGIASVWNESVGLDAAPQNNDCDW